MRNIFDEIDPLNKNGADLVVILKNFKDSLMSGLKGPGKPDQVTEGGSWVDDTFEAAPDYRWDYKLFTGDQNVTIFSVNTQSGLVSFPGTGNTFDIKKVSNDAAGPELTFLKERVSFNGQVKAGDSLGDVLFKGKDDTGATRVSARVRIAALEDFVNTKWGSEVIIELVSKEGTVLEERVRIGEKVLEVKKSFKAEGNILSQTGLIPDALVNVYPDLPNASSVYIVAGTAAGEIQGILTSGPSRHIKFINIGNFDLVFKNLSDGAAVGNKIATPKGTDLKLKKDQAAEAFFDELNNVWRIISSGGGSGNGNGILGVADVASRNAIPADERTEGMVVYVQDRQMNYQLRGGVANDKWVALLLQIVEDTAARNLLPAEIGRKVFNLEVNRVQTQVHTSQWANEVLAQTSVVNTWPLGGVIVLSQYCNKQTFFIEGEVGPQVLDNIPFQAAGVARQDDIEIILVGTSDDKPVFLPFADTGAGVMGVGEGIEISKGKVVTIGWSEAMNRHYIKSVN